VEFLVESAGLAADLHHVLPGSRDPVRDRAISGALILRLSILRHDQFRTEILPPLPDQHFDVPATLDALLVGIGLLATNNDLILGEEGDEGPGLRGHGRNAEEEVCRWSLDSEPVHQQGPDLVGGGGRRRAGSIGEADLLGVLRFVGIEEVPFPEDVTIDLDQEKRCVLEQRSTPQLAGSGELLSAPEAHALPSAAE